MYAPKSVDREPLGPQLARQLTAIYIASRGDAPRWFADGMGYRIAEKLFSRDDEVKTWEEAAKAAALEQERVNDFVSGRLSEDRAALVGYHFISQLAANRSRFSKLMKELQAGKPFDSSIESVYGGSVNELLGVRRSRR